MHLLELLLPRRGLGARFGNVIVQATLARGCPVRLHLERALRVVELLFRRGELISELVDLLLRVLGGYLFRDGLLSLTSLSHQLVLHEPDLPSSTS